MSRHFRDKKFVMGGGYCSNNTGMIYVFYIESGSEKWDESDDDAIDDIKPAPKIGNNVIEDQKLKLLIKWMMVFISRLRILFFISDAASNFLKFFSFFLGLISRIISPSGNIIVTKVPTSFYMMRQMLGGINSLTTINYIKRMRASLNYLQQTVKKWRCLEQFSLRLLQAPGGLPSSDNVATF